MMINSADFYESLCSRGVDFFTGVPDSLLANFCAYVDETVSKKNHIIAVNEGASVALAIGHYLRSGNPSLVYLQNSGLGNTVNPIISLADEVVYGIPMLLLVGWRGEPGFSDEPQHIKQGAITEALLDALGISYCVMSAETDYKAILDKAFDHMTTHCCPFVILIKKATFESELKKDKQKDDRISREKAISIILDSSTESDSFVCTTGKASRELYELRKGRSEVCSDFLTVGGMGHASSIAMGVKIAGHVNKVFCIDGDGAFLMHMGAAASIAAAEIKNFVHIILDNGCHESVGGQPTISRFIDFSLLSTALGYSKYYQANNEIELGQYLNQIQGTDKLVMLRIMVSSSSRSDLGRPTSTPRENKKMFMLSLDRSES